MIFSYKAVGTFDRISAVLLIFNGVLLVGFLCWIKFFLFGIDLVFVFWFIAGDVNGNFDFDVFISDENDRVDCFAVNKIVCRKLGLIIS